MEIAGARGPTHLAEPRGEVVEVALAQCLEGQPGGKHLELGTDRVRLQELACRRTSDASSAEGAHLDDPDRLEVAQRLPHRRLARPELARDAGLDDPGSR